MIVWASEIPLPLGTTPDKVLALAETWLRGSPHLPFGNARFPQTVEGDIVILEHLGHVVKMSRIEGADGWWAGCQHSWTESAKREWITQIIAHGTPNGVAIGVRLDCNLLAVGQSIPQSKKPYIIKLLLSRLGGGADSWLTVDDTPTFLAESQVDEAASVIDGTTEVTLPVVYVSALSNHRPYVDPIELAKWLGGMAHVVVEPSRHFSFAVARRVARKNPYDGAIAVLWPRAAEPQVRLLRRDFGSAEKMALECAARVRDALAAVRTTPSLSWGYVEELVARRRVEALKKDGSTAVTAYASAFDAELQAKQNRIDESEREIGRLHSEIRRLQAAASQGSEVLDLSGEREYYPGEIRDALLYALEQSSRSLEQGGRRLHIVEAILSATVGSGTDREIADRVKQVFSTSGELSTAARRTLEDLDFEITEEGKHYKASYHGDGRYTFTISKSSSDHRAGKNLASQICRTLFR